MIKAIETQYKGYRFRSRLEARWAVFFDALGIEWEYEKEGYDLGEAGWYLPDFWLPEFGIWVEIKGKLNWIEKVGKFGLTWQYSPELRLCESFRDQVSAIACFEGTPGKEKIYFCGYDLTDSSGGSYDTGGLGGIEPYWGISPDGEPVLCVIYSSQGRDIYAKGAGFEHLPKLSYMPNQVAKSPIINKAYRAAKSARFEHGENG